MSQTSVMEEGSPRAAWGLGKEHEGSEILALQQQQNQQQQHRVCAGQAPSSELAMVIPGK
jgi:hypothetical protein